MSVKGVLLRRWKILIPLVALIIFIGAEKSKLIRTDSVSAVACATELFRSRPEPLAIIRRYRATLAAQASRQDLPPEILATIIYTHQRGLTSFRRFTDCAGSAIGGDLSLGLGQIRISTAAGNDGKRFATFSIGGFRQYRSELLDPVQNIRHLGREVRLLLDRNNRFPGIAAQELIHHPSALALLMSEYRMGRQAADSSAARLGSSGLRDLGYLEKNDVYIFGRSAADVLLIQGKVSAYLDNVYCEKDIFIPWVCERRRD
jgi:hypothetical protein